MQQVNISFSSFISDNAEKYINLGKSLLEFHILPHIYEIDVRCNRQTKLHLKTYCRAGKTRIESIPKSSVGQERCSGYTLKNIQTLTSLHTDGGKNDLAIRLLIHRPSFLVVIAFCFVCYDLFRLKCLGDYARTRSTTRRQSANMPNKAVIVKISAYTMYVYFICYAVLSIYR